MCTSLCPCIGEKRECDPEKCTNCHWSENISNKSGICNNMAIQQGKSKVLLLNSSFHFDNFIALVDW